MRKVDGKQCQISGNGFSEVVASMTEKSGKGWKRIIRENSFNMTLLKILRILHEYLLNIARSIKAWIIMREWEGIECTLRLGLASLTLPTNHRPTLQQLQNPPKELIHWSALILAKGNDGVNIQQKLAE
jgi:hypothetical protein